MPTEAERKIFRIWPWLTASFLLGLVTFGLINLDWLTRDTYAGTRSLIWSFGCYFVGGYFALFPISAFCYSHWGNYKISPVAILWGTGAQVALYALGGYMKFMAILYLFPLVFT